MTILQLACILGILLYADLTLVALGSMLADRRRERAERMRQSAAERRGGLHHFHTIGDTDARA